MPPDELATETLEAERRIDQAPEEILQDPKQNEKRNHARFSAPWDGSQAQTKRTGCKHG